MKVTDLHLYPNHTFKLRKLTLDDSSEASVMVHKPSEEGLLVRPGSLKFHPAPISLLPKKGEGKEVTVWDQLLAMPDPDYIPPKKVSRFAIFNGDNPFLVVTSAGCIIPMPDIPREKTRHVDVMEQCSEVEQEAIDSKGMGAAMRQKFLMTTQVIFAGVVALAAIAATAAMLPKIMDNFSW